MSYGHQLTEEERNGLHRPRLECIDAQELFDVWMLPLVEEVGGILEKAHQLFESGQFQGDERILGQFEHALITAISELEVVKGWRASCSNMSSSSSDKECRGLKGEEEDTSEGKVLKEGSEAGQFADQQADCGKLIRILGSQIVANKKYAAVSPATFATTNGDKDMNKGKVKEGSSL